MTDASGIAAGRLQSLIQRIERLESEKAVIANDIKEIYQEAKSAGFDTKVMRQVVRLRKMDRQEREEQEQLLEVYMGALGQLADTPLGQASAPKVKPEPEERDGRVTAGAAGAKGDVTIVRRGSEATVTASVDKMDAAVDAVRDMLGVKKQQLAAAG